MEIAVITAISISKTLRNYGEAPDSGFLNARQPEYDCNISSMSSRKLTKICSQGQFSFISETDQGEVIEN